MRILLDIETTLDHQKIWCVVTKDIDTGEVKVWKEASDLREYIKDATLIVAHNGIAFDFYLLNKLWNCQIKLKTVKDTLVLSRLLNPSREGGHSLSSWGETLGTQKIEFDDFDLKTHTIDEMIEYCIQDVEVLHKVYNCITYELKQQEFSEQSQELEHEVQAIIALQERNGFKLDQVSALQLLSELKTKLDIIQVEMQRIFPAKVESNRISKLGKPLKDIVTPFNPGSRKQIGERLAEKGWKPKVFTESGQAKIDETTLEGIDIPEAKAIAEYLMLQKRIAQVESWLEAVKDDGRVHGRIITSGAVTYRATHMSPNMAQVPASKKPYGHECRALWTVEEGNVLVGCDLSGIELRCFAHYLKDEEYSYAICEGKSELGTDVHTRNKEAFGCETRDQAKTILYATLYGASPSKIGTIIGGSAQDGQKIITNFIKSVPAYGKLKQKVERFAASGTLPGLGGYRLQVRSSHSALNTLLQSAGAIIAKQWIVQTTKALQRKKIPYKLVGWIHDEIQIETKPEYAEELGQTVVECAKIAGEMLDFRVPVGAEYKIGKDWSMTH